MRPFIRNVFFALGAISLFLTLGTPTQAETCDLELKLLEPEDSSNASSESPEYLYRQTYPQSFYRQMNVDAKGKVTFVGNEESVEKFKKQVKKEPKYNAKQPFFGVAKIGSQEYLFVFDSAVATPSEDKKAEKKEVAKEEKGKKEVEAAKQESKRKSFSEWMSAALLGETVNSNDAPKSDNALKPDVKSVKLERLYFDLNRNGDLTDDKVLEGKISHESSSSEYAMYNLTFPRIETTIDVAGSSVKTAFFVSLDSQASSNFNYDSASINAGAYRIGEITLDGKKRRVVLTDTNSNGLFNDEFGVLQNVQGAEDQVYPQQGDSMLIDPGRPSVENAMSPYDLSELDCRYNVGKIVSIDGRYYEMSVSPAGDKLSLEPSKIALGAITNPNEEYVALIYCDKGLLKIKGKKDVPVAVPEGEWKLLSCEIIKREKPKPLDPPKIEAKDSSLAKAFKQFVYSQSKSKQNEKLPSIVSADGTAKYRAVKVEKGKTSVMPFGPPYKPTVTAIRFGGQPDFQLTMTLVGSAGEICGSMICFNRRPGVPHFEITDPKGKVVEQGDFEYG